MAIFRVEKTKDYTVMSNYHLRDTNLSLKAKGLRFNGIFFGMRKGWIFS